jgi:hypothetical protein
MAARRRRKAGVVRAAGLALTLGLVAMVGGCSSGGSGPPTLDGPPSDRAPDRVEPDAIDRPVDSPPEAAPEAAPDAGPADRPDASPDGPQDTRIFPDVMPARFVLTPESHNFQTVPQGMSGARTFTLENLGDVGSGTPSVTLAGASDGNFQIASNQCETSLDPQTSCTIEIQFSPSTAGAQSALLEVEAAPGGRVSAQLDGTGGN